MGKRLYMRHLREVGMCNRGARQIAAEHGFDWQDFLDNGVDLDLIRHIDDAMVQRVIAIAEAEEVEDGE